MIAIIETGGKQYRVSEGDTIKVEKLVGDVGSTISFSQVLLVSDSEGQAVEMGAPYIEGKSIEAEIVEQGRDKKIMVVKYKPKTRYTRRKGHRQHFTKVKITKV